jgi:hypothetical protein
VRKEGMSYREDVKGYILADKIFAWKPNIHYALFFTSNRIVAAKIGGQLKEFALFVDLGVFAKKAEELKDVSIESLLKADKDNFEIPYSEITKAEIRKAGWKDKLAASRFVVPGIITIMGKEEHKFLIAQIRIEGSNYRPQKFEECVDLLRSVLSSKVSIKE